VDGNDTLRVYAYKQDLVTFKSSLGNLPFLLCENKDSCTERMGVWVLSVFLTVWLVFLPGSCRKEKVREVWEGIWDLKGECTEYGLDDTLRVVYGL